MYIKTVKGLNSFESIILDKVSIYSGSNSEWELSFNNNSASLGYPLSFFPF